MKDVLQNAVVFFFFFYIAAGIQLYNTDHKPMGQIGSYLSTVFLSPTGNPNKAASKRVRSLLLNSSQVGFVSTGILAARHSTELFTMQLFTL